MRKVDFLKNTLKCGVLSSNLLNSNAMQICSRDIAEYKINDNEYISEIEFFDKGCKGLGYKYITKDGEASTLEIKYLSDCIKIIDLATKENFRKQGFATKLLLCMFNSVYKSNNGKELPKIILDSTAEGYNLYKNLGFIDNGRKDNMGLQPMILTWNSEARRNCLTLNENNEIVKINNINNNNGNKDDISDLL